MSPRPGDKGKQKAETGSTPEPPELPDSALTEAEKKQRSFERSLAGPSVGKAGLTRDQTGEWIQIIVVSSLSEINKIIAEVSKVSLDHDSSTHRTGQQILQ